MRLVIAGDHSKTLAISNSDARSSSATDQNPDEHQPASGPLPLAVKIKSGSANEEEF
jgi:hypothetical protein